MENVATHTYPYVNLTKPGIIMGNVITTAGGFALASRGSFNFLLFLVTLLGISLIIASACVCNNFIDRSADGMMSRTKNRPLARGVISSRNALFFALALGLSGAALLYVFVNMLALAAALFGFLVYVALYSFSKYRSIHGTLIGSVAGALPPVVGYCAASGSFDGGALIFFLILALWQMPHFFAIAIRRLEEYAAASIPVLPVVKGLKATKIQMLCYILIFTISTSMLTFFGYAGPLFLVATAPLGLAWLVLCIKGFKSKNDTLWARQMFLFSLVVIMGLCAVIPFSV
jgi:protoheme IX farnesyltransferase